MPNGEQVLEQGQEGEDSTEESGDWQSPDDEDEEESNESVDEEAGDSPPCLEHRSKQLHDPVGGHSKNVAPSTQMQKRTRHRLRSQQKKSPSSPRLLLQKLGRLCPGSRWMFLLPLGEYPLCVYLYQLILLF